jgi:hypothetical protein
MMIVARGLPHLLSNDDLDQLITEWRLYENELIPNEWHEHKSVGVDCQEIIKHHPIDYYWKHIFAMKTSSGSTKFLILSKLVKSILSSSLVTDDRSSLSSISINGLRTTKDAVKFHGSGKVHEVSTTINS